MVKSIVVIKLCAMFEEIHFTVFNYDDDDDVVVAREIMFQSYLVSCILYNAMILSHCCNCNSITLLYNYTVIKESIY